jgi:hypothetical protein
MNINLVAGLGFASACRRRCGFDVERLVEGKGEGGEEQSCGGEDGGAHLELNLFSLDFLERSICSCSL